MKFRINVTTFDPMLVEAMTRLGKRRGVYIEKALSEFLSSRKGKDVYQMMTSEVGETTSDGPGPVAASCGTVKRRTPKPAWIVRWMKYLRERV